MDEKDLISKKELLQLTGISYGQLYRWKRENLIPEAWFIKKSSFTGQETFFPREKIIKRTEMILELKDKYSLEELARILTPEATSRTIGKNELYRFEGINGDVVEEFVRVFRKDYFTFSEFIFINIISNLKKEFGLGSEETEILTESVREWIPDLKIATFKFVLCRTGQRLFSLLLQHDAAVLFDSSAEELKVVYLDEFSKDLNLKFNEVLEEF